MHKHCVRAKFNTQINHSVINQKLDKANAFYIVHRPTNQDNYSNNNNYRYVRTSHCLRVSKSELKYLYRFHSEAVFVSFRFTPFVSPSSRFIKKNSPNCKRAVPICVPFSLKIIKKRRKTK